VDIDQLLEEHPAPWKWDLDGYWDSDGGNIPHDAWDIVEAVNAYAALKVDNAALRKCVEEADEMRRHIKDGLFTSGYADQDYDEARKELP
jgi:hypothetical protein